MKRILALLSLATFCANDSRGFPDEIENPGDGTPTPFEEEIRWHLNRGRFDSARENQQRDTSHADVPATAGPLAPHQALTLAARRHSEDMARNNTFQHDTIPGSAYYNAATHPESSDRMRAEGYSYNMAGENIAAGYGSGLAAYLAWWHSAGHRTIMFDPRLREIGNGHFHLPTSYYRHYYTMNLGARTSHHFFTGTIFFDTDDDGAYAPGEGVAEIQVRLRHSAAAPPRSDVSSGSGAFAVPISGIPAGTKVEVWLFNPRVEPATLTIPRDYDARTILALGPGSEGLAGFFIMPADDRNIGFRDLVPPPTPPKSPKISITRSSDETELRWASETGVHYLPQVSADLAKWTDLSSAPLAGTGGILTHRHRTDDASGYYRLTYGHEP